MQARGLLMIEHRLIERMLSVIGVSLSRIQSEHKVDPLFVDIAVDFIRTYADRTHHGKEEDILFKALEKKPLSADDRKLMDELISEHLFGRQTTQALVAANERYRNSDLKALDEIAANLKTLIDFYPKHIDKEDKLFFPSAKAYFTEHEDQAMLADFNVFDQKMIHEKYKQVISELEKP